jgi:hypothetical protein
MNKCEHCHLQQKQHHKFRVTAQYHPNPPKSTLLTIRVIQKACNPKTIVTHSAAAQKVKQISKENAKTRKKESEKDKQTTAGCSEILQDANQIQNSHRRSGPHKCEKGAVVALTNAIVDEHAVMIEPKHTSIHTTRHKKSGASKRNHSTIAVHESMKDATPVTDCAVLRAGRF